MGFEGQTAELLDKAIEYIRQGLSGNLGWLDHAYGRAERLVKHDAEGRRVYMPAVYAGNGEYLYVSPDAGIGNFCFFTVDDPQEVGWEANLSVGIKAVFSIIFWFDYRTVGNDASARDKEAVKKEILDALNGGFWMKTGSFKINRVYELAENIYRGFSLDEVDNQFLMHPFGGFRFEGALQITETCRI